MTPEEEKKVIENLPLVSLNLRQIMGRMSKKPTFLEWDDLEQAGREGLIQAVLEEKARPEDVRWTTFAHWYIRQAIRDALEGSSYKAGERRVRLPHRIHVAINAMMRAEDELIQKLKREPHSDEIAEYMGLSPRTIEQLKVWNRQNPESSDWMEEDEDGNTIADLGQSVFDPDSENIDDPIAMSTLKEVMNSPMLSEREVAILLRSLVSDESLTDIGDELSISRQRVHQIQNRALRKVRNDSRMRRHDSENLFTPNMRTAHLYRYANIDRSDKEWWAENTVLLEWTEKRRRQWKNGSVPRQVLGFNL